MNCCPSIRQGRQARQVSRFSRSEKAFTMVEIALCLAVIAFALVAIIGVLPAGLRVQKDNREDTIINQDGALLLEAIRSQSQGLDYLTNYFDLITVSNSQSTVVYARPEFTGPWPANPSTTVTNRILTDGTIIMQLLTRPKYVMKGSVLLTNLVYANVRAISGSAVDKGTNATTRDFAFAYQLKSEVIPLSTYPPEMTNFLAAGLPAAEILTRSNLWRVANNQATNFTELRLTLQGPILRKGGGIQVAGTPRTFRAVLNGWRQDNFNTIHPNLFIQVQ